MSVFASVLLQIHACLFGSLKSAKAMLKLTFCLVIFIHAIYAAEIFLPSIPTPPNVVKGESLPEPKEIKKSPSADDDKDEHYKVTLNDEFHDHERDEFDDEEGTHENKYGENREARQGFRQGRQTAETPCFTAANNATRGTCILWQTCQKIGGIQGAKCPTNGFVCCSTEKSCHDVTEKINNTKFINPGYPKPDSGTGACSLTINRMNDNICQLRFDFRALELSQPDANGNCVTDFLTVTQGTYAAPIICGSNTGQHKVDMPESKLAKLFLHHKTFLVEETNHELVYEIHENSVYVDVDPLGGAVRLTVDRTAASMSDRMWNVEVAQIECTSKFKAPSGCLQYFTETSGTVNSFNFKQDIDERSIPQTTRQIVDMSYAVCIKAADGYCSVMWTRNITGGDHAFTVSSNIAAMADSLIGDPAASSIGGKCTTDYVVIPGGIDDIGTKNDRFCGAGFPNWVTTNMRPFIMFVKTDNNEKFDVLNRGFSLDYRQTIC